VGREAGFPGHEDDRVDGGGPSTADAAVAVIYIHRVEAT
jgi:hypothetical protein